MPKKDSISDEDKALFRDSVKGVTPMGSDDTHIPSVKPKPKPKDRPQSSGDHTIQPDWSDGHESDFVDADGVLSYKKSGVNERDMRDLKGAKFPVSASLDLHGMSVDTARAAIYRFIQRHSLAQRVCVCIIHGKGQRGGNYPVLKTKVNTWLRQSENVVAFHSAPPRLGGTGALLVILN